MSLLLLLGGASSPAAAGATYYLTGERLLLYLASPDRTERWRIGQYTVMSFEKTEHDFGAASITAPSNAHWIGQAYTDAGFDVVTGWEEFSLEAYIDGTLEWCGPILRRDAEPGQALHAYPSITFSAETFTQHFAKRRANNSTNKADITYTDQADDIIRQGLRNCNGTITPTGYPVGVSRGDFGSWTVAVEADTGSASSISIAEQEGGNVLLFVTHVAEKGDCYIYTTPSGATFTYGVSTPYQANDRTASIVLSPASGTVPHYSAGRTLEDVVSVAAIKGAGAGTSQIKKWYSNTASVTARGVWEGEVTNPAGASTTYTDSEGDTTLTRQAAPTDTLEIDIRSTPAARFVYHASSTSGQYGMRDKVNIVLPQITTATTAIVRGWKIEQSGTGPIRESVKIGDLRISTGKYAMLWTGFPGPFSAGSRYHTKSGA